MPHHVEYGNHRVRQPERECERSPATGRYRDVPGQGSWTQCHVLLCTGTAGLSECACGARERSAGGDPGKSVLVVLPAAAGSWPADGCRGADPVETPGARAGET